MATRKLAGAVLYASPAFASIYLNPAQALPFFGVDISSRFVVFALWLLGSLGLYLSATRLQHGPAARLASALLLAFGFALSALLAVSLYLQGTGFNARFFWHLNAENLGTAWQVFRPLLLPAAVACLALVLLTRPTREQRQPRPPTLLAFGGAVAGFTLLAPVHSLGQYMLREARPTPLAESPYSAEIALLDWWDVSNLQRAAPADAPNLAIVFLESVELGYFDETRFPDLLPNLQRLRRESVFLSNRTPFPEHEFTIGALASIMCALPLTVGGNQNQVFESHGDVYAEILCLPEVLQGLGYGTTYMGGARLDFAGKGMFLRANGFDNVFGVRALAPLFGGTEAELGPWGLYDADLLRLAGDLAQDLAADNAPFLLSLLTVDTHDPDGTASPGCTSYPHERDTMLDAVHCTDQLVGRLVARLRQIEDDRPTRILVMNDHLVMRNTVIGRLEQEPRRSFAMFLDSGREPAEHDAPITNFDLAPTILSMLGHEGVRMGLGRDVASGQPGLAAALGIREAELGALRYTGTGGAPLLAAGASVDREAGAFLLGPRRYPLEHVAEMPADLFTVAFRPERGFEPEVYGFLHWQYDEHFRPRSDLLSFVYSGAEGLCVRPNLCPEPPYLFFGVPEGGPYLLRQGGESLSLEGDHIIRFLLDSPPTGIAAEELRRALTEAGAS